MFLKVNFLKNALRRAAILLVSVIAFCLCLSGCSTTAAKNQKGGYRLVIDYFDKVLSVNAEYITGDEDEQKELVFCFYPAVIAESFSINGVAVNGIPNEPTFFGENGEFVSVSAEKPFRAGDVVCFDYTLVLRECGDRLGITEHTVNLAAFYPMKCVFDGGFVTHPYSRFGDPFYCEFNSYEIKLSVPSVYAVACGFYPTECNVMGEKTEYVYQNNYIRNFAVCLSAEFNVLTESRNGHTVGYYYYDDENPEKTLETVADALDYFCGQIGDYAYDILNFAQSPYDSGGMEYSAFFVLGESTSQKEYLRAAAHETAHQWFPIAVGSDEYERGAFDEGLVEFLTRAFVKNKDGVYAEELFALAQAFYEGYKNSGKNLDGEPLTKGVPLDCYSSLYEYAAVAYAASSIAFENLCVNLGEKTFYNALSRFYENNRFKNASATDFFKAFPINVRRKAEKIARSYV